MHDLLSNKLAEPTEDLSHDLEHLLLFELLPLHELFEITVLAKLSDDVETILGAENIFELDDIGVIETFEEVYL